ncbi:hypothetical protein CIB48_g857 [Xylaria polymorpha]|nr:hypothetical protein CIB48_g857 [Xylaria polymorpha]
MRMRYTAKTRGNALSSSFQQASTQLIAIFCLGHPRDRLGTEKIALMWLAGTWGSRLWSHKRAQAAKFCKLQAGVLVLVKYQRWES